MEILMMMWRLQRTGLAVHFCWVPAHVGVHGEEIADNVAKKSIKNK